MQIISKTVILLLIPSASVAYGGTWGEWNVFEEFHTDIRLDYDRPTDAWDLWINRGAFGEIGGPLYPPAESIFLATGEALREVPPTAGPAFSFLGEPGDTFYLLPAHERPRVLYLGFNGYGVAPGVFQGPFGGYTHTELVAFSGPSDFFLYRPAGGGVDMFMDTRSPSPPYGVFRDIANGHSHMNWVFRERGVYILDLVARGEFADGSGVTASDPVSFFFLIDPHPIDWWRLDTFRENANDEAALPQGDISGDGYPNLLAYAFAYSPFDHPARFLPRLEIVMRDGHKHLSLVIRRPVGEEDGRADRTDLRYRVESSENLLDWAELEEPVHWQELKPDFDDIPRMRVVDPVSIKGEQRRFIRVGVERILP